MKKLLSVVLVITVLISGIGCGKEKEPDKICIGISMPSKESLYQNQSGNDIKNALIMAGCDVELKYAENDAEVQASQIKYMTEKNCSIIIVQPVDSVVISDALQDAKKKGITVISYDDLIMDSDAVSYYVTFDKAITGRLIGRYIVDSLKLDEYAGGGTYTLEIFSGIAGDDASRIYYDGAMEVLRPYIDSGVLCVPSGRISYEETVSEADEDKNKDAEAVMYDRMTDLLDEYYGDELILDAVLCTDDSTALNVSDAIEDNYNGDFPVITGCGCSLYSVRGIAKGRQTMSVFSNPKLISEKTIELVNALLSGSGVSAPETYNNGIIDVPSFVCVPVVIDTENYEQELIESGYYTENQIND